MLEAGESLVTFSLSIGLKGPNEKLEKFAVAVHVLQKARIRSFQTFHVVISQRTAKKRAKTYNTRAEPLYCSPNLLFSGVLVAVAVVVLILNATISSRVIERHYNALVKPSCVPRTFGIFL